MKKICVTVLFLCAFAKTFAGHIAGGEMYYTYVGPGTGQTDRYKITLRLFRQCNPDLLPGQTAAPIPTEVEIAIFDNSNSNQIIFNQLIQRDGSVKTIKLTKPFTCIINPPEICYQIGSYSFTIDLPKNRWGYTAAYQTCCRSYIIKNIEFAYIEGSQSDGEGATYSCDIPGTDILGNSGTNNSAVFSLKDTVLICQQKRIYLDFSATDADGDSLSYYFLFGI